MNIEFGGDAIFSAVVLGRIGMLLCPERVGSVLEYGSYFGVTSIESCARASRT